MPLDSVNAILPTFGSVLNSGRRSFSGAQVLVGPVPRSGWLASCGTTK